MDKNLVIGLLITYVSFDIISGIILYQKNPALIENISQILDSAKGVGSLLLAIVIACLLSDCFGQKKLF